MPTPEEYMEAAKRAHVAGDAASAKRLFDLAQQPASPAQKLKMGTPEAAAASRQSFLYGALRPVNAAASMLTRGLETLTPEGAARDWLRGQRVNVEQANQRINEIGQENVAKSPIGPMAEFGGNVAATLPMLAAMPARILGSAALGGAAAGGAGAMLQPVAPDESNYWMEKAKQGALGAATGAVVGAAASKIGKMIGGKAPPASAAVKAEGGAAYEAAFDPNIIVKGTSLKPVVDDIQAMLAKEAFHPKLQPRVMDALEELQKNIGKDHTLEGVDVLRRIVRSAGESASKSERRLAGLMVDKIDDFVGALGPKDIVGNVAPEAAAKSLSEARNLWSRASKGELIEGLFERAANRAGQFTGSGYENALRTEFRAVAQNARKMRTFSKEEQAAIQKVARGGPLGNLMRWAGKAAPRGIVSTALSGGVGHAIGGPVGAAAMLGIGELGRAGATAATSRNAKKALALMLQQQAPKGLMNPADTWLPYLAGGAGTVSEDALAEAIRRLTTTR